MISSKLALQLFLGLSLMLSAYAQTYNRVNFYKLAVHKTPDDPGDEEEWYLTVTVEGESVTERFEPHDNLQGANEEFGINWDFYVPTASSFRLTASGEEEDTTSADDALPVIAVDVPLVGGNFYVNGTDEDRAYSLFFQIFV